MSVDSEVESLIAEYGTRGNVGTVCAAGNSEYRELIEALRARGMSAGRIAKILREKKDFQIGESAVNRHLRGICKCARG